MREPNSPEFGKEAGSHQPQTAVSCLSFLPCCRYLQLEVMMLVNAANDNSGSEAPF